MYSLFSPLWMFSKSKLFCSNFPSKYQMLEIKQRKGDDMRIDGNPVPFFLPFMLYWFFILHLVISYYSTKILILISTFYEQFRTPNCIFKVRYYRCKLTVIGSLLIVYVSNVIYSNSWNGFLNIQQFNDLSRHNHTQTCETGH